MSLFSMSSRTVQKHYWLKHRWLKHWSTSIHLPQPGGLDGDLSNRLQDAVWQMDSDGVYPGLPLRESNNPCARPHIRLFRRGADGGSLYGVSMHLWFEGGLLLLCPCFFICAMNVICFLWFVFKCGRGRTVVDVIICGMISMHLCPRQLPCFCRRLGAFAMHT
jgi:hypothetical protein